MNSPEVRIVLTTAPDHAVAEKLVRALVDERLAACGTILPGATSIYRWSSGIEQASEVVVILKTSAARSQDVMARIPELHPYDVPEVVIMRAEDVFPAYARWVLEST